jgi:hypothetical protein
LYIKQVAQTVITGHKRYKVMSNNSDPTTNPSQPMVYQIRIKGHLGHQWTDWFEGLTITLEEDGDTLLSGPVADQAALHGLLKKVRDLGLPLVSVVQVQLDETHPYRSKKEIKMNTKKETARKLPDVRIILAVLWVAGMLSSLNGDTYRLSAMTKPLGVSSELLSVFAVVLVGHVFMSGLTLTLKSSVSRWANRIIGIFYAMIIFCFWVNAFVSQLPGYEIVWATAQLVFALMVVWYAWKWTNSEG